MSLFKDGIMRKPDKANLRHLLLVSEVDRVSFPEKVIDGGALLHHVHWPDNMTYHSLLMHHVETIRNMYGTCHIVFDGYSSPSIKDQEHARRSAKTKSKDVIFTSEMKVSMKCENFLSNNKNKAFFIKHLSMLLQQHGQEVADADTDTVKVAIKDRRGSKDEKPENYKAKLDHMRIGVQRLVTLLPVEEQESHPQTVATK